jgi:raffinose/stachyose/melibiose transport system permease protein
MILPLFGTLNLSLYGPDGFVGLRNFRTLFGDPRWAESVLERAGQQRWFFVVHMLVQNPIGRAARGDPVLAAAAASGLLPHRDLRPHDPELRGRGLGVAADAGNTWGIAPMFLDAVGLRGSTRPGWARRSTR